MAGGGRAVALTDRVALYAMRAGGMAIIAAAALVSVDVILRKLFSITLGGADELSGYALAIASSWSFASVLMRRGHVRVDALYRRLPPRARAALDLAALLVMAGFGAVLARWAWRAVETSWSLNALSNTALKVPLWIPQGLWWSGLALFGLTAAGMAAGAALALLRGDSAGVQALFGARTIEEEAADETRQ